MADYAAKARELVAKAEKRVKAFSLFGASTKYEDAAEMLERAANQFKLAKSCEWGPSLWGLPLSVVLWCHG